MCCRLLIIPVLFLMLAWAGTAWAVGQQFNGTCNTITWNANTEPDLAGYELFDRTSTSVPAQLAVTTGTQNSVPCVQMGFNQGQHYLSIRAFDLTGNRSGFTAEIPFVIILDNHVKDLRVTTVNANDMVLAWTEVQDGVGAPATYDIRLAAGSITWGSAVSVSNGTCSTPVAGVTIGATKTCTVTGLAGTTAYQFQLVPYRGTPGSTAVYGPLSNITGATTGGSPPVDTGRLTVASDEFTRSDNTDLGPDWTPIISSPWSIVSNHIRTPGSGSGFGVETHNAVLPNDQWAESTIQTITGAANLWVGVTLRASESVYSSYQFLAARGTGLGSNISKVISGTKTQLITESSTTWATTDILRAEARGTTLSLYRNDVLVLTVEDSSFLSGKAGVWGYIDATPANMQLTSFRSGGFSAAATSECGC
jgi:hypothetical protein